MTTRSSRVRNPDADHGFALRHEPRPALGLKAFIVGEESFADVDLDDCYGWFEHLPQAKLFANLQEEFLRPGVTSTVAQPLRQFRAKARKGYVFYPLLTRQTRPPPYFSTAVNTWLSGKPGEDLRRMTTQRENLRGLVKFGDAEWIPFSLDVGAFPGFTESVMARFREETGSEQPEEYFDYDFRTMSLGEHHGLCRSGWGSKPGQLREKEKDRINRFARGAGTCP